MRGGSGSWSGGFWAGLTIRSNELRIFVFRILFCFRFVVVFVCGEEAYLCDNLLMLYCNYLIRDSK